MNNLKKKDIDFFLENGYLAIGKIIDDDFLKKLQLEYDKEFIKGNLNKTIRNLSKKDDFGEEINKLNNVSKNGMTLNVIENNSNHEMLQIMQMSERNIFFRKLIYYPLILNKIADLLGDNIQLYFDQALYKPAKNGGEVHWHYDNVYWKCEPANLVSCWITLDDAYLENGAMQVIPGSHKNEYYKYKDTNSSLLDFKEHIDLNNKKVIPLPAGGAMFHHCKTMHYTQNNNTDHPRRALSIHYMNIGTKGFDINTEKFTECLPVNFSHPILYQPIKSY